MSHVGYTEGPGDTRMVGLRGTHASNNHNFLVPLCENRTLVAFLLSFDD